MQKDNSLYKILVVEDNPGDLLLVEDYLEEAIVAPVILTAQNFEEAHDVLTQDSGQIDAVLLDLTLPDLQGEPLIKEIISVAGETPIIILTGYTDLAFATRSISWGVSDYLLKDSLSSAMLYKSILYNIERNKYLVSLKESEQRYSDLFHLSPQPMWVYDVETLEFMDVNDAAVNQYGYSHQEFVNMTIKAIRPKSEIPKMEKGVEQVRANDKLFSQGQYLHKKKNGKLIIVEIRSNIIYYNGRKAEIVLASDVTDRHKQIQAIEEQNKKLREIAWTQSHKVRAPVARIMGLLEILTDKDNTPSENNELLRYLMDSAKELDNIIREIVSTSHKIDSPE
ncbi:MAG: PAS domain S-box protein [Bacteroidia bacterium]